MARALLGSFALALLLIAGAFSARADDAVIDRWYAALLKVDRAELSSLLANDARIELSDLGIEQTKTEFIASMDEWEEAVKGASIRHRIEKTDGDVSTVLACYHFAANDLLMRETFAVNDNHISVNTQTVIAENCESY